MKNNKIKTLLAVVLAISLGSSVAFAASVPADVKGQACEKAVQTLVEEGIVTGDTDGLFHPEANLTRAQVSVMIGKAIKPDVAEENEAFKGFSDMSGYSWAGGAIGLMSDREIAKGYPDGTFKPGADVTVAELITFVMRACGYDDDMLQSGIWPDNYINEAKKLGIYKDDSGKDLQKVKATKEQAATVIYNALDKIKEEAKKAEADENMADFVYGDIKFDENTSYVNGKALASDAKIYVYGKKSDYSENMKLPEISKLSTENVYKYKNVSTVGFYKVVNGKVTAVILPENIGFTGKVYGVITDAQTVTIKDEGTVTELETLAAGKEINWLVKKETESQVPSSIEDYIKQGKLTELKTSKGKVTSISTVVNTGEEVFPMVLEGTGEGAGLAVAEKNIDRNLLKLSNEKYVAYRETTVVYVLNEEQTEYKTGTMSSVKKGYYVRAYDITDDDNDEADIIIVCEKPYAVPGEKN
ncbi:MAG: S-layer homology domain-containing protein [Bacillota bacterium]|nr:S-layer homology domain-containing protein [Bacillota bacterium]